MAGGSLAGAPTRLGRRVFRSRLFETIVSPNGVDRYAELVDPTWSVRDVRARVESVERTTPRSITLSLRPNTNWQGFRAGQHLGVTVEVDGVLTTRFYSPASSAASTDGLLELTVTAHPEGTVSRYLFEHAQVGMVLGLSPAEGEFSLPAKVPSKLLLISGGSGITPVMAMLRTLVDQNHTDEVTFIHFARTPLDAIYADELADLDAEHEWLEVLHGYTREGKTKSSLSGRLTRTQLGRSCPNYKDAEVYVCGPNELVAAAEKIWSDDDAARLHTESFTLPEPVIAAEDATGQISFTQSGVVVDNDGRPLLTQAEANGLTPRCGCRMGICHTCIAHVDQGVVRNARTGELKTVKDEQIQICVNAPIGDIAIDL